MAGDDDDYELADALSKLFDGHQLEDIIPLLINALAFAISQSSNSKRERLILYEAVARDLLTEVLEMPYLPEPESKINH